jgi:flagellar biosynthesis/type III secretory pathway protein FliH
MRWWSADAPSGGASAGSAAWSLEELAAAPGGYGAASAHAEPGEGSEARHRRELDEAYERGLLEGAEDGEGRATAELASAVTAAHAALVAAEEVHGSLTATLHEDLLALSCAIAREIVGRELRDDPAAFADLVRQALAAFPLDQPLRIRVHPGDLSRISAVSGGEVIPIARGREVRWVADAAMVPGGCVVDGPNRVLDGRVDQALQRVFWELYGGD